MYDHQERAYHGNLDPIKINKALTLHPVKEPAYMFRLHYHFMSIKLSTLHYRGYKTSGILRATKRISSGEINPTYFANRSRNTDFFFRANSSSELEWEYITQKNKHPTTMKHYDLKTHVTLEYLGGVQKIIGKIMYDLNEQYRRTSSRRTKSTIRFEKIHYGYLRINPKYGVQCQVCLSIRNPNPPLKYHWIPPNPTQHKTQVDQAFSAIQGRIQTDIEKEIVHFIVPLREKFEEFTRFLASLKDAFLVHHEPIAVLIVYFPESSSPSKHIKHMKEYELEFPGTKFLFLQIPGEFNRGKALQKGVEHVGKDSLVFFADVDLVFQREFVHRCRGNTKRRQQVYMPLMFGQYNPDIVYFNKSRPATNFAYTKSAGRWRIYSYGPVCVYRNDVKAVGGLKTDIKGWGKEDTNFADRVTRHGLTTFRAPDQGIIHIFHGHVPCDETIPKEQRYNCQQATFATYAPKAEAVDYLIAKRYLN